MFKFVLVGLMFVGFSQVQAKEDKKEIRNPASIENNVMVGGQADIPACHKYGVVLATTTLLSFNKSGQMSFTKVDVNTNAFACDSSFDGEWVGIVYGKPGQDCEIKKPIPIKQEYKGPCKSGWIKKQFFETLAG